MPHDPVSSPRHPPSAGRLRLVALGAPALFAHVPGPEASPLAILGPGKALALVAFLHGSPGRSASRELLADHFWDDADSASGRHALRQLLHRIRRQLGPDAVRSERGLVTLVADLESDREDFQAAIDRGRFREAVDCYGGDFFSGFAAPGAGGFERWATALRATLRSAFLRAAAEASRHAIAAAEYREALRISAKARNLCPHDQSAWRLHIEAYEASGNLPGALAEIEALLTTLRSLGDPPEPASQRLIERVQSPTGKPRGGQGSTDPLARPELVGRSKAFGTLTAAWDACQHQGAQHVHLVAPAGLGKSRLLDELAWRLRHARGHLVSISALQGEREHQGALLSDLATALVALPGARSAAPASLGELAAIAPQISSLIGPLQNPIVPQRTVTARVQALADVLTGIAETGPLAVLMDDLHWADAHSLAIVGSLLERVGGARILVVTASRSPAEVHCRTLPTNEVALLPLSAQAVGVLVCSLGANPEDPRVEAFAARVHASSGGSPLLVLNLLRLALESGAVSVANGEWEWHDPQAALQVVAETDPLARRLESLGSDARRVLTWLAAAQVPLLESELLRASGAPGSALDELERHGLITRQTGKAAPAHNAIASAALDVGRAAEGREMHRALGGIAEADMEANPAAFVRAAAHYRQAGDRTGLQRVFRRRLRHARRKREPVTARDIAAMALGSEADPEAARDLIRAVPLTDRLVEGWRRHSSPLAAALMLISLSLTVGMLVREAPAPTGQVIVALRERPDDPRYSIFEFDVHPERWREERELTLKEGRRLLRLPPSAVPFTGIRVSPAGLALLLDQFFDDSGGVDLMVYERGAGLRRLTDTSGDDFGPDWAPDGSAVVFATARWTPHDDNDADIAILSLSDGTVRQLTRGPAYDQHPRWSPDGTRIGFVRLLPSAEGQLACWTTLDGVVERCRRMPLLRSIRPSEWADGEELILAGADAEGNSFILSWRTDTDSLVVIPASGLGNPCSFSPRATACFSDGGSRLSIGWRGDAGTAVRVLQVDGMHQTLMGHVRQDRHPYLSRLEIGTVGPGAPVGVPTYLTVRGYDEQGGPVPVPAEAVTWSIADSAAASIDARRGVLTGRRPGSLWVHASAGDWRTDSVEITLYHPRDETGYREDWDDSTLAAWSLHGYPVPRTVVGPERVMALHVNGDHQFRSGAHSRTVVPTEAGIGLEGRVSIPIRATKWQSLVMGVTVAPEWLTGGFVGQAHCRVGVPREGEGTLGRHMYLSPGAPDAQLLLPEHARSGAWVAVRLQVFPDGTCGLALNGVPVARIRLFVPLQGGAAVTIEGQSVGTDMLAGPFEVWSGIRTDIDWAVLEKPPHAPRSPP